MDGEIQTAEFGEFQAVVDKRVKTMEININTLFMDREFFNSSTISTLHTSNTNYIIAAKSNKKINP